jgi:hypothetical protein
MLSYGRTGSEVCRENSDAAREDCETFHKIGRRMRFAPPGRRATLVDSMRRRKELVPAYGSTLPGKSK